MTYFDGARLPRKPPVILKQPMLEKTCEACRRAYRTISVNQKRCEACRKRR